MRKVEFVANLLANDSDLPLNVDIISFSEINYGKEDSPKF